MRPRSALLRALLALGTLGGADPDDPRALLEAAKRLRGRTARVEEVRRAAVSELALRAFDRACERAGRTGAVSAEACFRRGEMLRADGRAQEAELAFECARISGETLEFGARATIEIGHLHRRAGRPTRALDAYFVVAVDPRARRVDRDIALLWAGDMWRLEGAPAQAMRGWRHVAQCAERPLDRIRAYDRIALLELEEGRVDAARDVLAECDAALGRHAVERTELGERVRRALANVRARKRIDALEVRRTESRSRVRFEEVLRPKGRATDTPAGS